MANSVHLEKGVVLMDTSDLTETSAIAVLNLGRLIRDLQKPGGEPSMEAREEALDWLNRVQVRIDSLSVPTHGDAAPRAFASPLDHYVVAQAARSLAASQGTSHAQDVDQVVKASLKSVPNYIAERKFDELSGVLTFLRSLTDLSFSREDASLHSDPSMFAAF
jgi:hypothetical protein